MEFLLCTLTQEVLCWTFHRNHVIWRTKITKFWRNGNDSKQPYWMFDMVICYVFLWNTKIWVIRFCQLSLEVYSFLAHLISKGHMRHCRSLLSKYQVLMLSNLTLISFFHNKFGVDLISKTVPHNPITLLILE